MQAFSTGMGISRDLVSNADSGPLPRPVESEAAFYQSPQVIHLLVDVQETLIQTVIIHPGYTCK